MRSGSTISRKTPPCQSSRLPSSALRHPRHVPPGRASCSKWVAVKPRGPIQCLACDRSVHTFQTSVRGASKVRVMTSTRSSGSMTGAGALALAVLAAMLLLLGLQLAQVFIESIEAFFPEPAVALEPVVDLLEARRLEPARPALRLSRARDQPGALQHLEGLGDGGPADRERPGEAVPNGLAPG